MISVKISQNFIKSPLKFWFISQISVHSLWHVWKMSHRDISFKQSEHTLWLKKVKIIIFFNYMGLDTRSLCSWGDWFESLFFGNPEDMFVVLRPKLYITYSNIFANEMLHIWLDEVRNFVTYLRNRSALAVNCCIIIHCLEVSCKEDQITSAQRTWFILVQLTDKQWIITQQFTH